MGANESPAVSYAWSGWHIGLSPRILPWLAILGLCLLRPNRCLQAWLVWLPLLGVTGIGAGIHHWLKIDDPGFRLFVQLLPTALAFGWTASLLLVPLALRPTKPARFPFLLLGLTVFSLLELALGYDWKEETFVDVVCALALQFMVFGLAAALSLAGRSASRRFTIPRLLGWLVLWSLVVWLALAVPPVSLSLLGNREALYGISAAIGCCCLISLLMTLPFLALAAAVPRYRQRLEQLAVPPQPAPEPAATVQPQERVLA